MIERVDLWQRLKTEGLTADEMLEQVINGDMKIHNVRAVRIKGGTTTSRQNALIEALFKGGHDRIFSPNLFHQHGLKRHAVMKLLEDIANDKKLLPEDIEVAKSQLKAKLEELKDPKFTKEMQELVDAVADVSEFHPIGEQLRFFDNSKYKVQTHVLGHEAKGMTAVNMVNSVFKMSLLFGHLTGYIIPQTFGMFAMQLLEEGAFGAAKMIAKTPHVWRQLSPEAQAMIQTIRGAGIAKAAEATGEVNPVRRINDFLADGFGVAIDSPFRTSSFLHFADLLGYKTKIKGWDKAGPVYDVSQIEKLVREGQKHGTPEFDDLMTIEHMVGEEYGRFSRLGPTEKNIARFVFFYPWLERARSTPHGSL